VATPVGARGVAVASQPDLTVADGAAAFAEAVVAALECGAAAQAPSVATEARRAAPQSAAEFVAALSAIVERCAADRRRRAVGARDAAMSARLDPAVS
jgi:hypothetical protein